MATKIDNVELIKKIDCHGMLAELEQFPKQLQEAHQLGAGLKLAAAYKKVNKILICGMGGSAIVGDLLQGYLKLESELPVIVNRDSHLPAFVDRQTLVFVVTYSGNTKETLHNFQSALAKKAKIIAVTSGGKMCQAAILNKIPYIKVKADGLPRASIGLLFFPVLNILQDLGLIADKKKDIRETLRVINRLGRQWGGNSGIRQNRAKILALSLLGKIPVLYGATSLMDGISRRWKGMINENTKMFAAYNTFPEIAHNEIECWQSLGNLRKHFKVIVLQDRMAYPEDKKRLILGTHLIEKYIGKTETAAPVGTSALARLFSMIYLGDLISVYLAFLYATDPSLMPNIDYIKKHL
ncbi:MAG: bifunctional phosphoglucose/phosphomannose isomerase [bacterium]|jgi:glucose/mannose-6-phosphate isomerase|nr:bifunctional phosphoglucose/phosphomannose isomerase [bacterium]MDD5354890.1 bifunctional phosphoglucose/phosphomannose isomerase [bacterium]